MALILLNEYFTFGNTYILYFCVSNIWIKDPLLILEDFHMVLKH